MKYCSAKTIQSNQPAKGKWHVSIVFVGITITVVAVRIQSVRAEADRLAAEAGVPISVVVPHIPIAHTRYR